MNRMNRLKEALQSRALTRYREAARHVAQDERGDVPGWVLVTLMTAGIVVALWAVAEPLLTDYFEGAITEVSSQ